MNNRQLFRYVNYGIAGLIGITGGYEIQQEHPFLSPQSYLAAVSSVSVASAILYSRRDRIKRLGLGIAYGISLYVIGMAGTAAVHYIEQNEQSAQENHITLENPR